MIFCGPGATAAVSKLIGIMELRLPAGLDERYGRSGWIPLAERPVVFVGPYEHHSNELPWRQSIADVVVIAEDADGHIDLADLERQLARYAGSDLMTAPAITIGPDAAIAEAAGLMYDHRVTRLPVVSAAGQLVGIVSRADVLSVFERADEQVRTEIVRTVVPDVLVTVPADFKVTVRDGIVTMTGSMASEGDARSVVEAVRHVEGVVAVRDRLSRTEPGTL
ncbi:MAG: CBS domain-containing protein [Nocardiopsaceae bacterium]|nr:CBS domain-containing protein [Nocardiopsaceae bacterium]